ncbi:4Fe-4S dicluster domain-containing protein [Selenihalanaerobacter shriftii]|uniref:4Fe-4S dicluster domain-containing protein n=1 Tax=Selenihalanaerobacter shriftii TaxID=142842 RepID=A0A1T4NYD3_9FIRM|nr:4Fe-4S dicluster domain-containing protein [Selenihalanaerobacter shriftii]SJZ83738.1 4Fe-4S dicluster domain-containing protein [Selenihalanaerobacter shriftii]
MEDLTKKAINFAKQKGADLVGVVDVRKLDFPNNHHPTDYLSGAKSAVSIAYALNKGGVLNLPTSRNSYMLEFNLANQKLNLINHQVGKFLEEKGHLALGIPGTASIGDAKRLAADISHKHIAVAAGLGKFGLNNLVITPEYGPRVRFTTILTTAELAPTSYEAEQVCNKCLKCIKACPRNALDDWENKYTPQEGWHIDKEKCYHEIFVKLGGKRCGICIKACPLSN